MILKTFLFRILTPIGLFFTVTQLKAQQQYNIQGTLSKGIQGKITLIYQGQDNNEVKNTAEVKNGSFVMKGSIDEPVYAILKLNPDDNGKAPVSDIHDLFLDPGKTTVISSGRLIDATITGGGSQNDYLQLMKELKVITDQGKKLDSLYQKYSADGNEAGLASTRAEGQKLIEKRRAIQNAFIKDHPDSYVAFSLWMGKPKMGIDASVMEREFNAFSARVRNSVAGKAMAKKIAGH